MKGIIKISSLKLKILPYKKRSEFEMEKLLNKHRALARKKQIEMVKLEQDIPFYPLAIPQYMTPARRINFIKIVVGYLRMLLP